MKVAVIGGGGTGMMMAGDLTLRGFEVALFDFEDRAHFILEAKERGYIELVGNAPTGKAKVHTITTDIREALLNAKIVLVSAVVHRQEELIEAMAPHLSPGQVVCFSAGNGASLLLRKKVKDKGILIGEMQGNVYPCRRLEDGRIVSAFEYKDKAVAAFPAMDNQAFVEQLSFIYPCYSVKNVFQAILNAPNISIHLPATLLGITKMETTQDFRLYRDGMCPSVLALIQAFETEKKRIMDFMGYDTVFVLDQMRKVMEKDSHSELDIFRELEGPDAADHRYITEDAQAGNSLLLSLAKRYGIPSPINEGLVSIASALNGKNYYQQGRTLENFGLADLSVDELNGYLENGV